MNFERSLALRMKKGEFITSIQLDPPASDSKSIEDFSNEVAILKENGVNLVDVNDSRREGSMDPMQLATHLSHNEMEVIPHITSRDTTVNGLWGQISAAYTYHNIRNVLVVTGDPYDHKPLDGKGRGVFQTRSIGIIKTIDKKRKDTDHPLNLTIAAAVDQNAHDLTKEGRKTIAKEHAGADYFMSQPVFSKAQAEQLREFYGQYSDKPLLVGIWPPAAVRTVDNIHSGKIKGVVIPETIYEKANKFREKPDDLKKWAMEHVEDIMSYVKEKKIGQGVYIVAPLRKPSSIVNLTKKG